MSKFYLVLLKRTLNIILPSNVMNFFETGSESRELLLGLIKKYSFSRKMFLLFVCFVCHLFASNSIWLWVFLKKKILFKGVKLRGKTALN